MLENGDWFAWIFVYGNVFISNIYCPYWTYLCIQPSVYGLVPADKMVSRILAFKSDPVGFHRAGNIVGTPQTTEDIRLDYVGYAINIAELARLDPPKERRKNDRG